MDDSQIVELFLQRDENAIKQTTEKYGSRLLSLANGIVNDQQTAEECENDTYMHELIQKSIDFLKGVRVVME